ncbi:hypothetical protein HIM_06665 [Hirsutella minnesotensis 3608]|uniref:Glycosyl transferase CAP10 domain-containing protein n=1 Tax=Hirsutella minnesotensis 3608 TaxID=1043627 RepID=A0A0F7ZZC8_9HYPO|nr:hypothetical protein HIM_06665 [Hirsutella minnesotensis 3608]
MGKWHSGAAPPVPPPPPAAAAVAVPPSLPADFLDENSPLQCRPSEARRTDDGQSLLDRETSSRLRCARRPATTTTTTATLSTTSKFRVAAATMIKTQHRHWLRPLRLRYLAIPALLWLLLGALFFCSRHPRPLPARLAAIVHAQRQRILAHGESPPRMASSAALPKLPRRIACYGPRRKLLSDSPDDALRYEDLHDVSYPVPFLGSHRALGLERTWMTADGRYGPYGYGQDDKNNRRSKVDWDKVDWGALQDDCFSRNARRFPGPDSSTHVRNETRFALKNQSFLATPTPSWNAYNATRRTALVIRTWSNYDYKPEDLWNIRSLIVEASLRTGAEYAVTLLVHVRDRARNIFESKENYDAAFRDANIPPEFQSMAVLWDDNLLESWYELVGEHRTMWAVNQPFQLFALHYPEFDHYWQIEIDQRFLGDAGKYLDAVSNFARNEPRKQALERATYAFNEDIYGTYQDLIGRVNVANKGKSRAWGPVRIPDVQPIGPDPPVARIEDDSFTWGVGEDADVVVTSFCADVLDTEWAFRDYIKGFKRGRKTPRWFCPPAVMRASRPLLLSIHQAQHDKGLNIPSEAVLPTWALWLGLKLSYPPQPAYMRPHEAQFEDLRDDWTRDPTRWLNTTVTPWFGNKTEHSPDGLSHGNPQSVADRGLTWWWTADYPRKIMDVWLAGDAKDPKMPGMLAARNGKVYVPNMAMHPVKT